MEVTPFFSRKPERADVAFGVGAAFLTHFVVICVAIFLPGLHTARKPVQLASTTVSLVSVSELGGDPQAPSSKGDGKPQRVPEPKSAGSEPSRASTAAATRSEVKPSSVVPVKRLQFDGAPSDSKLEKYSASEVPETEKKSSPSVEDRLDDLIVKPKPKPKPNPPSAASVKSSEPKAQSGKSAAAPAGQSAGTAKSTASGSGQAAANSTSSSASAVQQSSSAGGSGGSGSSASGGGAQVGMARRLYYTEVWNAVRSQWVLPKAVSRPEELEAILVLLVRRDGKVMDIRFEKKSGNTIFDESVIRAVRKSDPLPPFPDIYSPSQEEIGLRFRPEDLV